MRYTDIIWDWNGTLIDDVDWCITRMNKVLEKRNKKTIGSIEEYHSLFSFPIINYYKNLGFDFKKESFEALAKEYIDYYHSKDSKKLKLYDDVEDTLDILKKEDLNQIILSASSQKNLDMQISPFNIRNYFNEILGISNIYAKSKIDIGADYINKNKINRALIIGDTVHDYEVAEALNIDCILISRGHQSKDALKKCNVPVFDNLKLVMEYII